MNAPNIAQPAGSLGSRVPLEPTTISAAPSPSPVAGLITPVSAMGAHAGLRVLAERNPDVGAVLEKARGQSWREVLGKSDAVPRAAADSASRGQKVAERAAAKGLGKNMPKSVARSLAGKAAAQAGAKIAARGGMWAAARVAGLAFPPAASTIMIASYLFDPDSRKLVNGLISTLAGVGFPPDEDAAPSPPRTVFLPLCGDGNRDDDITRIDQGMAKTNSAAFNFHPDDVWPSSPNIETTQDFNTVADRIAKLGSESAAVADRIREIAKSVESSNVGRLPAAAAKELGDIATAFDEFTGAVPEKAAEAVQAVSVNANAFYQKFREINHQNRAEIANSTSGLIPFRANHVNTANMDDSLAAFKNAVGEIRKNNDALAAAFASWEAATGHAPQPAATAGATPAAPPPAGVPTPPPGAPAPVYTPPQGEQPQKPETAPEDHKPSADTNPYQGAYQPAGLPGAFSPPQTPSIPSWPTGQGTPAAAPVEPTALPQDPEDKDGKPDDKDGKPDDKDGKPDDKDGKPDDKDGKPDDKDGKPEGGPGVPGAARPKPDEQPAPPPPPPGADRTVRIGTDDYQFDSPRIAAAIRETIQAAQNGPGIPIQQALADQGFVVPPEGQDIGQQVEIREAKPGAAVISDGEQSWYLGNGKALTEQGEVKDLAAVANFTGPNQGVFSIPEPGTPVVDRTAAPAGVPAATVNPAHVTTNDIPPATEQDQQRGGPGL